MFYKAYPAIPDTRRVYESSFLKFGAFLSVLAIGWEKFFGSFITGGREMPETRICPAVTRRIPTFSGIVLGFKKALVKPLVSYSFHRK